jgi:hypothetical protein
VLLLAAIPALILMIGAATAAARAARTRAHPASVFLNETGRLRLTSHHGFTLNEQGRATGTIAGSIYIHLHVVSPVRVTAEVNIYPHGGSLTGYASAGYHPSGRVAHFNGTMRVARGTGRYRHAHASALSFTGTITRINSAITVYLKGRLST